MPQPFPAPILAHFQTRGKSNDRKLVLQGFLKNSVWTESHLAVCGRCGGL